ncbi:MAG: MFS transporter [Methanobacteriaceae archaeon]|nr:MFS transporter [Methanobacteriaceae archaeon]
MYLSIWIIHFHFQFIYICSLYFSGEMFLFFRILQAIGNAMIFANLNAMISSAFPVNQRGRAFGLTSMGVFVGLIFGPILGGIITEIVGWKTLFYLDTVIGIIAAYAITRFKHDWIDAKGEKLDILGSINSRLVPYTCILCFLKSHL